MGAKSDSAGIIMISCELARSKEKPAMLLYLHISGGQLKAVNL
jgi:hypothetical protein